jgi:hypothetical protein
MIPSIKGTREETCSNQPGSVSQELGFENRISKWIPWFIIIWPVKYQYLTHITYPYHTPIFAQSRSETCQATDATLCVAIEWVLLKLRSLFCLSIPPRCDQKQTEATTNTKSIWGYLDYSGLDSVWDCMGTSCRSYSNYVKCNCSLFVQATGGSTDLWSTLRRCMPGSRCPAHGKHSGAA